MYKKLKILLLIISALIISSCSGSASGSGLEEWSLSTQKGTRDNTPVCLIPKEDMTDISENDLASINYSNANEGYVIVKYTGKNHKVKLQIKGNDGVKYTYSLKNDGTPDVFPLSAGDGGYNISVFENIQANQYSLALSTDIDVKLRDAYLPFLYPNQYVKFTKDDKAIAKAVELAYPANNDLEVVSNVYNYIIRNVSYDTEEAETVTSGYLPDIDEVLETGKGICLDYASLMTAMLRSQQIPARMEIGYAGTAYHAWISVYIDGAGWINGLIQFDGVDWSLMDPTFAASNSSDYLKSFIGDGKNYTLKYIY